MYDVAVIGAGPSGCMVAALMAAKGYSVVLLEEHAQAGEPVNCSGIIGIEAFEHFDLPEESVIRLIDSFHFFSPGGACLVYRHPAPLAVTVDRALFDRAMASQAVSAGAVLRTGARVSAISSQEDQVVLTINQCEQLRSKLIIIATGAGSKLTHQVGLGAPRNFVLGAQAVAAVTDVREVEVHLGSRIAPSNFGWVVPLEPGHAKIGLICERDAKSALMRFLESPSIRRRLLAVGAIQCSLLPLNTIERSYTHRTIVVGEAAGQIKTITCGGIYYGLLAAEISACVLHDALQRKNYDESVLAAYELRWKQLLDKELSIGLKVRSFFEKISDTTIDALFEVAAKDGIIELVREKASFDWHYDLIYSIFRHVLVRAVLRPLDYGGLFYKSWSRRGPLPENQI